MAIELSCTCYPEEKDGYPFVQWIALIFHECYYSPIEVSSFILGLLNIVCWLVAQVPQVIKNFMLKDGGALSLGFMLLWLLGDITNLLGCVFTNQLPTQLYVSVYYCMMDIIILSQMWGFAFCRKHRYCGLEPLEEKAPPLVRVEDPEPALAASTERTSINSDSDRSMTFFSVGGVMLGSSILAFFTFAGVRAVTRDNDGVETAPMNGHIILDAAADLFESVFSGSSGSSSSSNSSGLPSCKTEPQISNAGRIIGDISAWVCFLCYFFGRVPQIIMNYKRKATEGLSLLMFFFAILANLFYGTSIVIMPIDTHSSEFWEATLPYILGSYGCILPSVVVLWQFFRYRHSKNYRQLPDDIDPNAIIDPNDILE